MKYLHNTETLVTSGIFWNLCINFKLCSRNDDCNGPSVSVLLLQFVIFLRIIECLRIYFNATFWITEFSLYKYSCILIFFWWRTKFLFANKTLKQQETTCLCVCLSGQDSSRLTTGFPCPSRSSAGRCNMFFTQLVTGFRDFPIHKAPRSCSAGPNPDSRDDHSEWPRGMYHRAWWKQNQRNSSSVWSANKNIQLWRGG